MISNMLRFPSSLFDDLDEMFFTYPAGSTRARRERAYPPVNMGVTDSSVEVYVFAPGMKIEDIDVTLEKNLLSISGERKPEEVEEEATTYREERFKGSFKRVITLPDDVDPEKTEAVYRDGVLHISIAKRSESQPRKITINA
jgi:HSP20 family protein